MMFPVIMMLMVWNVISHTNGDKSGDDNECDYDDDSDHNDDDDPLQTS